MLPKFKPIADEEFARWLSPPATLDALPAAWGQEAKLKLLRRALGDGMVQCGAGHSIWRAGKRREKRANCLLTRAIWEYWRVNDRMFWDTGNISFEEVIDPTDAAPSSQHEAAIIDAYEIRFNPAGVARLAGQVIAAQPKTLATDIRQGGSPGGKHGEPIARTTIRLIHLSAQEIERYTGSSLAIELMNEYRELGLPPPSETNAQRLSAGILKAVREAAKSDQ